MNRLNAQLTQQDGTAQIHLDGYLSSDSAGPLEEAFEQLGGTARVVLVFAEKAFVNSAGLAVLFDLIETAQEAGKRVRVVQPSKHFRKVFDIVGLSQDVDIFEELEPALAV
ncbi:MAG: STAS domain-containing protein [Candidatus Latescibacteria bacterium]|nr:STAS domain-containing protein [Candidatus Latescibacterota bacterium]